MILKGFIGTIYVRIDETSRLDLWRSDTWMTPFEVVDEMIEKKLDILERLTDNSRDYSGYNKYDEKAPENADYLDRFEKMIAEFRSGLGEKLFDDSYDDVEIVIDAQRTHISQMTQCEWARICETQPL